MKQPSNETCLAAELMRFAPPRFRVTPFRAAHTAALLCALGRRYRRLSERLCGGEEEWGRYPDAGVRLTRAEKRRDAIADKAALILEQSPFPKAVLAHGDLCLKVTHPGEETALL